MAEFHNLFVTLLSDQKHEALLQIYWQKLEQLVSSDDLAERESGVVTIKRLDLTQLVIANLLTNPNLNLRLVQSLTFIIWRVLLQKDTPKEIATQLIKGLLKAFNRLSEDWSTKHMPFTSTLFWYLEADRKLRLNKEK